MDNFLTIRIYLAIMKEGSPVEELMNKVFPITKY